MLTPYGCMHLRVPYRCFCQQVLSRKRTVDLDRDPFLRPENKLGLRVDDRNLVVVLGLDLGLWDGPRLVPGSSLGPEACDAPNLVHGPVLDHAFGLRGGLLLGLVGPYHCAVDPY